MSLVVAALAAAGAGVAASALLLRAWWRRRGRGTMLPAPAAALDTADAVGTQRPSGATGRVPASAREGGPNNLWLGFGDVVQIDGESLWLCAGALVREAGVARAGLWWPGPGRTGAMVVELREPERRVYWLREVETLLPPSSPTRLEIGGTLMDRRRSFPAQLERLEGAPEQLAEQAVVSLYAAASGEVAVVVQTNLGSVVASGRAFELGEIDRLGYADPAAEVGESLAVEPDISEAGKR